MPNHIHIIWEILKPHKTGNVKRDFLKYTGQQILERIKEKSPSLAEELKVELKDRVYQFWEKGSHSFELYSPEMIFQKLVYVHNNPCMKKWLLADEPVNYKYSSAKFYETGIDNFGFLSNIAEVAY